MPEPAANILIQEYGKDPFLVLIGCLLSLRAKDLASLPAARAVFSCATTPQQLMTIPLKKLENLIYSVGFYRKKSRQLHEVSKELLIRFNGKVPGNEKDLLSIKGVGRKTANLILGLVFDIPAICVDIHVHRISNRLGLVSTKTPAETERALQKLLPEKYWIEFNTLLVTWGQNICVPISPFCSRCVISDLCPKRGVTKSR